MTSDLFQRLAEGFAEDEASVHPVEWAKDRAGIHLWSKQREIAQSILENKRTAVRSAHTTGKSYLASLLACWWIDTHPIGESFVISTAPSTYQVHAVLWEYIRKLHGDAKLAGKVQISDNWLVGTELVGFGRKPQDHDQHSFRGFHRPYVLFILDEAGGLNKWLWTAAEVTTNTPHCRILAIGNPDDPASEFARVCKSDSQWNKIRISAYDTPNFTGEEVPQALNDNLLSCQSVEDWHVEWGEQHPYWFSKVLAEFPDLDEYSVIPSPWVDAAIRRWEEWDEAGRPEPVGRDIYGLDVARYGNDKTVIAFRRGDVITGVEKTSKLDTEQVADFVKGRVNREKSKGVIDVIGVGAGVYDKLRRDKYTVEGFNAGIRTNLTDRSGKIHFSNVRTAGWWRLREALDPSKEAQLCLPPSVELAADLTTPKWKDVLGGKVIVESKDDIRKRLGRSTDYADAVIMAMWISGSPVPFDENSSFSWTDRDIEGGAFAWEDPDEWKEIDGDDERYG